MLNVLLTGAWNSHVLILLSGVWAPPGGPVGISKEVGTQKDKFFFPIEVNPCVT